MLDPTMTPLNHEQQLHTIIAHTGISILLLVVLIVHNFNGRIFVIPTFFNIFQPNDVMLNADFI